MAKPKATIWPIEEHTKAKHGILRGYLNAWLPIMARHNGRLIYVDGFAGPGVYEGGEPGSPIVALQAFLEHAHRANITSELIYVFIEEDPKRCNALKNEITKLGTLPSNVRVEVRNGAYEDVFSSVIQEVEEKGTQIAPTFAFVDPFGYAQATMKLTGKFLQFNRCEVLIYVPFRFIARFVTREGQEKALTALFGSEEWRDAAPLEGEDRRRFLHDLFVRQLKKECGLKHVRSFEIVTTNPNSGYHLFFGTMHELGLQRMKESMWKIDPVAGQQFKDSTSPDQPALFQPDVDTVPLRNALRQRFGTEPFTIEQADQFVLVETPYLPSHVRKRTLKPLEDSGQLQVVSAKQGRRKGTYPPGTLVRFGS